MKKAYERHVAEQIQPLIQSIAQELDDRFGAVRTLERSLRRTSRPGGDEERTAITVAALADQRREVRHATDELLALGCEVETGPCTLVRLPGPDGSFESGYELSASGELNVSGQAA